MLETRVEVNHRLHHTSVKLPNGINVGLRYSIRKILNHQDTQLGSNNFSQGWVS